MFKLQDPQGCLSWPIPEHGASVGWLELLMGVMGEKFNENSLQTREAGQVLFVAYLIAQVCHEESNLLVFEAHKARLEELLARWAVPHGGSDEAHFPFWRLQWHDFWRLKSWEECCEKLNLPAEERARYAPDATVGILQKDAWQLLLDDKSFENALLHYLLGAYWRAPFDEIMAELGVPGGRIEWPGSHPRCAELFVGLSALGYSVPPPRNEDPNAQQMLEYGAYFARPENQFERNDSYSIQAFSQKLGAPETHSTCALRRVSTRAVALFLPEDTWHWELSADRTEVALHWPLAEHSSAAEQACAEVLDSQVVMIFTAESGGEPDTYRYRGPFCAQKRDEMVFVDYRPGEGR